MIDVSQKDAPTPLEAGANPGGTGREETAMELISGGDFVGCALTCSAAQEPPVDIVSQVFAANNAARLALDGYTKLLAGRSAIGHVPQELLSSPAAFGEFRTLIDGHREVESLHVHGCKLHQTVYQCKHDVCTTQGIHHLGAECCNPVMKSDDAEVRRSVLAALVERDTLARVAERMGKPASQIKDMISTPPRKSFGEKVARAMEDHYCATWDKTAPPRFLESPEWLSGRPAAAENEAPKAAIGEAADLLADWESLPEGWRFYVCRKTKQLREIADSLPEFLKDSLQKIPSSENYWKWERAVTEFVYERNNIVEDDGYIGPDRRSDVIVHDPERRQVLLMQAKEPRGSAPTVRGNSSTVHISAAKKPRSGKQGQS